ncbi:cathepsin b, putative [Perkinsus marinus ATCC 50983]|uniref:Cathepsin b, putative n=1 Tax=Perkinsus marinus (strain ATCC 50983 / TXsc) TaxID=423536 RepID=C5KFF0_PERM5|nr:cathepsin b, putative [Perkinsus marinus ATCC 50983]EER16810.1 cathepsin b, putative [Perkinsus marinus ATCC 50983]|eukprot:XP_002785014.1 cathepsin b, putative [Perkinsus marinus ATCC 50983]
MSMVYHSFITITCIWSFWESSTLAIKQAKSIFDDLKAHRGLVYTPAEEAQHFARFEEELRIQSELISTEDLTVLYDETRPAIMQSLVDEINSKQNTWTASTGQKRFKNLSLRDARMLCGTLKRGSNDIRKGYAIEELQDLPTDFDARTAFPNCSKVIGHIRDQSACGSCWAFGVTEAFNDRLCIKSDGAFTELLSAGEMNACSSDAVVEILTQPGLGCTIKGSQLVSPVYSL